MSRDERERSRRIVSMALGASSVALLAAGSYLLLARGHVLIGGVLLAVAVGDALVASYLSRRR